VTPLGEKVIIDTSTSKTIYFIKQIVGQQTGISSHELQIVFQGMVLDDSANLAWIGVGDEYTLEMTSALITSSTSPSMATTSDIASSTTPKSFLAPKADTMQTRSPFRLLPVYLFSAAILSLFLGTIYWWRVEKKRRCSLARVTPVHVVTEPVKILDGEKSPFPKKVVSFNSNVSYATVYSTPDHKKPTLPHLLGNNGKCSNPRYDVEKGNLKESSSGRSASMQDTAGDETKRNLKILGGHFAHSNHFESFQKKFIHCTHKKKGLHVAPQRPLGLDVQGTLRDVAQESSAAPPEPEVSLQDLKALAARQAFVESTSKVTQGAGKASHTATSAARVPRRPPVIYLE